MRVRSFQDSDAPALAEIFFAAVYGIASAYYDDDQIRAWAPAMPSPERFLARARDGRTLLVAVDENDEPIAYGDCEADGHIDHLFCRPEHSRKGVAEAVYRELERGARTAGISRLYVEASEPARRFFDKRGFTADSRNDFEIDGVPIHNWRMSKSLPPE